MAPNALQRHIPRHANPISAVSECGGVIQAGEKYHRISGIWDDPMTYKTCTDCEALRNKYMTPYDHEWCYGDLREGWGCSDYDAEFEVIMLKRGAKFKK